MGNKMLAAPTARFNREEYSIFDDFAYYVDADLWTKLAADTNATVAHEGSVGKTRVKLFTGDAILNNEAAIATTNEVFKYIANKAIVAEARIEFAESATDDAKVAFGFADAIGANFVTDAAAITATDAAVIWKTTDDTYWKFHTEIGGLANKAGDGSSTAPAAETVSNTTAGGSSAQTLRIEIVPRSATVFEARPYVDGVQLKTASGIPIMHAIALGTATDMDLGAYVKAGSGTSGQETLYVDYIYAAQIR